jgi:hypothetical protein
MAVIWGFSCPSLVVSKVCIIFVTFGMCITPLISVELICV